MNGEIVYIVDDDADVREAVARLIRSIGLDVATFESAQKFLSQNHPDRPSCLILDVRMPGLSGLDLQDELAAARFTMPIIFITGHGNIPMSVRAMKAGAIDFLTKPFDDQALLDAIHYAIQRDIKARGDRTEIAEVQKNFDTLTPREKEVFSLVVTGMLNKQTSNKLGVGEKTIKVHRGRVMQKMKAESFADLVRLAEKLGLGTLRD